jgi:tetratricopeptide (TPR) repeat protein
MPLRFNTTQGPDPTGSFEPADPDAWQLLKAKADSLAWRFYRREASASECAEGLDAILRKDPHQIGALALYLDARLSDGSRSAASMASDVSGRLAPLLELAGGFSGRLDPADELAIDFLSCHHSLVTATVEAGDYAGALEMASRHARWDPAGSDGVKAYIGNLLLLLGRLDEAEEWFRTPPVPMPYESAYGEACTAFLLGRHAEAAGILRRAALTQPYVAEIILRRARGPVPAWRLPDGKALFYGALSYADAFLGARIWQEGGGEAALFLSWVYNSPGMLTERARALAILNEPGPGASSAQRAAARDAYIRFCLTPNPELAGRLVARVDATGGPVRPWLAPESGPEAPPAIGWEAPAPDPAPDSPGPSPSSAAFASFAASASTISPASFASNGSSAPPPASNAASGPASASHGAFRTSFASKAAPGAAYAPKAGSGSASAPKADAGAACASRANAGAACASRANAGAAYASRANAGAAYASKAGTGPGYASEPGARASFPAGEASAFGSAPSAGEAFGTSRATKAGSRAASGSGGESEARKATGPASGSRAAYGPDGIADDASSGPSPGRDRRLRPVLSELLDAGDLPGDSDWILGGPGEEPSRTMESEHNIHARPKGTRRKAADPDAEAGAANKTWAATGQKIRSNGRNKSSEGTSPCDGNSSPADRASSARPGDGNASSARPGNGSDSSARPGIGSDSTAQSGNGSDSTAQSGKASGSSAQPGNGNGSSARPGNGNGSSARPGNGNGSSAKSGNGKSHSSDNAWVPWTPPPAASYAAEEEGNGDGDVEPPDCGDCEACEDFDECSQSREYPEEECDECSECEIEGFCRPAAPPHKEPPFRH